MTLEQGVEVIALLKALLYAVGVVGVGGIFLLTALTVREVLRGG